MILIWSDFIDITGAQKSINDAVYLTLNTTAELNKLATSEGCMTCARQSDTVSALEELVAQWCQQIEQVTSIYIC